MELHKSAVEKPSNLLYNKIKCKEAVAYSNKQRGEVMIKFTGKGVYGGIAIGKVSVFKRGDIRVKKEKIEDAGAELARLEGAKKEALMQLESICEKALREAGESNAYIFEVHKMMIEDYNYNESIKRIITEQAVNAEYAVSVAAEAFIEKFSGMDDIYMQARAADIRDISNRIILCLADKTVGDYEVEEERIICAMDLTPSETVAMNKEKILAFVTAYGSVNSHTAILAKNMNIPAIVGLGDDFYKAVSDEKLVIVNGLTGEFIIEPDEETLKQAINLQKEEQKKKELLQKLKGKDNITLDGTRINICANIDSPEGIGAALHNDADGIGLFRSEFIYFEKSDYPTEEEQFQVYRQVLESMQGGKVVIRTLDVGADKQADYFGLTKEENPAMGLRAIRLCLTRPQLFKTQLRALYRASVYGKLGIIFPMLTSVSELEEILMICSKVKEELEAEGIAYSQNIELGVMVETPAAAIISDRLAQMVDFLSVGTNDLTQYTLACDRQNPAVERFCDTHHEAILRLIEYTVKSAHAHGAWIGICGELAADTGLTEVFLRMGIDELSVPAAFVLEVRDAVRNIDLSKEW